MTIFVNTDGTNHVRLTDELPSTIKAFTKQDPEGGYNVYLSAMLSDQERRKAYLHEVDHINGHDLEGNADILQREHELHKRSAVKFD